jgi:hypothetical protein
LRHAVKRAVVLRIELQGGLEIAARLGPFVLFG